jgi:hypothetical protein
MFIQRNIGQDTIYQVGMSGPSADDDDSETKTWSKKRCTFDEIQTDKFIHWSDFRRIIIS